MGILSAYLHQPFRAHQKARRSWLEKSVEVREFKISPSLTNASSRKSDSEIETHDLFSLEFGDIVAIGSPPSPETGRTQSPLDTHQLVAEAVNRLGGIEKATPKALVHELMKYEGLNLLDVHKHLEFLQLANSKGDTQFDVDDFRSQVSGDKIWAEDTLEQEVEHIRSSLQSDESSSPKTTRNVVKEEFRARLTHLALPLSEDEIMSQLESEEGMWLFCTLLPEDYDLDRDTLVRLWAAKGLIKGAHKDHIGDSYLNTLLSNGYILGTRTCFSRGKDKYRVHAVRMKDESDNLMHKELYLKLEDLYSEVPRQVQHLSLVGDAIDETSLETLTKFKYLKTLLLLCKDASDIIKIPNHVFLALKDLEVVDLSGTHIMELPSSIGNLSQLRYLDLSSTLIEVLPETMDCLYKLQTLSLQDCERLFRLPERIRNLTSLQHLDLDVISQLSFMPKGMGALTNLETLSAFLVDKDDGCTIKELKNLNNLKGSFCLSKLENVLSPDEAKEAAFRDKIHLNSLELRWNEPCVRRHEGKIHTEVLQRLQPHYKLEQLQISCYGGLKFPNWISEPAFDMLTSIALFKCENCNVLPGLEKLPSLKYLNLTELTSVKEIATKFQGPDAVAFPKLETLQIVGLLQLESWKEAKRGDYPRLSKLIIEECSKLATLPSLLCLNTLKHLEITHCSMLSSLPNRNLSTSLKIFIIENCPLITDSLQKGKGKYWHKIKHVQNVWIDQEEII